MWFEIKQSSSSAALVGYVHRNLAVTYAWFDDFVKMMYKVNEGSSNIVLLGDFNIDLLNLNLLGNQQPLYLVCTNL